MIPRDITAIKKMLEVENGAVLCPSCHTPYDKGKKRRLIDNCGHERCYQCMFTRDHCPLCFARDSAYKEMIRHSGSESDRFSLDFGNTSVSSSPSCRPKMNGHMIMDLSSGRKTSTGYPVSSSRPATGSPCPRSRQWHPSKLGDVTSDRCHSLYRKQPEHEDTDLCTRLGLLLGDASGDPRNGNKSSDGHQDKYYHRQTGQNADQRSGQQLISTETLSSFTSSLTSSEATSTSPGSTLTGLSGFVCKENMFVHENNGKSSDSQSSSIMSCNYSFGSPTYGSSSPVIPSRRHSVAVTVHRSNDDYNMISDRNSQGRQSERVYGTIKNKTSNPSAPSHKSSSISLKPLFFEIPTTEAEPMFVGRQWVFKEIEEVLISDVSKKQGVVIVGDVGHGKTSIILQLVDYSCFGRRNVTHVDVGNDRSLQCGCNKHSDLIRSHDPVKTLASRVVAYHFCQADNSVTCTVPEFIHNLAAQMCQAPQFAAYRELLMTEITYQQILSMNECVANPLRSLIKGILEPLGNLMRKGKIPTDMGIVVVDGISEAELHRPDYGETIASFLAKYNSRFPPWLKIIVTVRTGLQDIAKHLSFHRINLDNVSFNQNLNKDIRDYVGFRINNNAQILRNVTVNTGKIAEASPGRFANYLTTLSNGSFMFVKFTLDLVAKGCLVMKSTSFKVLPLTLSELYLLQFNLRFPSVKSFEKICCILNACLAALQPMTLLETYHTINASNVNSALLWEDFIQRIQLLTSAGFLVFRRDETMMFCHNSFKEWLSRRNDGDSAKFLCDIKIGHAMHALRLCRVEAPLSAEKTLELGHHILKAHIYKNHARLMEHSPRDAQALWMCLSSDNLSSALAYHRNIFSPNIKVSKLLLIAGADPNAKVSAGCHRVPVVIVAAKLGLVDLVSLLIEFNADVNAKSTENGMTVLSYAAVVGNMDILRMALIEGAKVNEVDISKKCALVHAAENGHLNAVNHLLQCNWLSDADDGIDNPDLCEAVQQALVSAALNGHSSICDYLLDLPEVRVNECDKMHEETALTAACTVGSKAVCSTLIKSGANVSVVNGGSTPPLICAVTEGHYEVADFLLNCCNAELEQFDVYGRTALMLAAMEGHHGVLELLLTKKASVNRTDKQGLTALCWACLKGQLHTAEYLLEHGSDINHTDKNGRTPLDLAAFNGNAKLVSLLIEKGAVIEHVDHNGMRPLDRAIGCKHSEVVICFLRRGAKLGPCTWLMASGKPKIILILLTKLMEDGLVLYRKNRLKEASHRFQYSLKKFPDVKFVDANDKKFNKLKLQLYLNLSRCKRRLNEYDMAVDLSNKALQIDPISYEGYYTRARAKRDLGDYSNANLDLERALSLAPPNPEVRKVLLEMQHDVKQQLKQNGGNWRRDDDNDDDNMDDVYASSTMLTDDGLHVDDRPSNTTDRNLNNFIYSTVNTDSGISLDTQIIDNAVD
ncbi:TANC2 (predicted) [Pycnogonum litorale]